jgi:hypothetical protein
MRTFTIAAFAEHASAIEKCDALMGGKKSLCVSDAKAHYGKS